MRVKWKSMWDFEDNQDVGSEAAIHSKSGYNKYRRTFTPLEVKVLVKYLGEP